MNANIVALGRVLLVFGYVLCFVLGMHFVGVILGINPLYLFLAWAIIYMGWIVFEYEKNRVIRERAKQEK